MSEFHLGIFAYHPASEQWLGELILYFVFCHPLYISLHQLSTNWKFMLQDSEHWPDQTYLDIFEFLTCDPVFAHIATCWKRFFITHLHRHGWLFLNICTSAWLTFFYKTSAFQHDWIFYQTSWFLHSGLFCKNICFSAWLTLWWTWRMLLTGEEELTTWSENQIYIQLLNCADDDYVQMLNRSKW